MAKMYLSFRGAPDVVEAIKDTAAKERRTASQVVEILLEEALASRRAAEQRRRVTPAHNETQNAA